MTTTTMPCAWPLALLLVLCAGAQAGHRQASQSKVDVPFDDDVESKRFDTLMSEIDEKLGGDDGNMRRVYKMRIKKRPDWLQKGVICNSKEARTSGRTQTVAENYRPQFKGCCIVDKTISGLELIRNMKECAEYAHSKLLGIASKRPKLIHCYPGVLQIWLRDISSCCCGLTHRERARFYKDDSNHVRMQCGSGQSSGFSMALTTTNHKCVKRVQPIVLHSADLTRLFRLCTDHDYFRSRGLHISHHTKVCQRANEGLIRTLDHVVGAAQDMYEQDVPKGPAQVRNFLGLCGGTSAVMGDETDNASTLRKGKNPRCEAEINSFFAKQMASQLAERTDVDFAGGEPGDKVSGLSPAAAKAHENWVTVVGRYFNPVNSYAVPPKREGDDDFMDDDASIELFGKSASQYAKTCSSRIVGLCLVGRNFGGEPEHQCHNCVLKNLDELQQARCNKADVAEFCAAYAAGGPMLESYAKRHAHDAETIGADVRPVFKKTPVPTPQSKKMLPVSITCGKKKKCHWCIRRKCWPKKKFTCTTSHDGSVPWDDMLAECVRSCTSGGRSNEAHVVGKIEGEAFCAQGKMCQSSRYKCKCKTHVISKNCRGWSNTEEFVDNGGLGGDW